MKRSESINKSSTRSAPTLRLRGFLWLLILLALLGACSAGNEQRIRNESGRRLVLFTFTGKAESVCLSGDFNDWSPDSRCLKKQSDRWQAEILLAPGRYRYGFLLDGKEWVPDPGALLNEEDGFGKKNSLLVVE